MRVKRLPADHSVSIAIVWAAGWWQAVQRVQGGLFTLNTLITQLVLTENYLYGR